MHTHRRATRRSEGGVAQAVRADLAPASGGGAACDPIRLVVANDVSLVRLGLASALGDQGRLRILGVASQGREALSLCEEHEPDVLVTGIHLARLHGLDLARQVADSVPGCGVVGLLQTLQPAMIWRCLEAGIDGLLCQASPLEELLDVVTQVVAGQVCLSPSVQTALVRGAVREGGHLRGRRMDALTNREREVAQLFLEGLSKEAIGRELHVSSKTVDSHRHHLLQKLGCRNVADLTRLAVQEGVIHVDR